MLSIVAHHFVVNSGLINLITNSKSLTSSAMTMFIFGAWGKVAINCFILITGYFMCTSNISVRKFIKLYMQIITYALVIDAVFFITGYKDLTLNSFLVYLSRLFPVRYVHSDSFISGFIIFWLCIPFLNILIKAMTRKQHLALTSILLFFISFLTLWPRYEVSLNPVGWFMILYFVASYLRLYPGTINISHRKWGVICLVTIALAITSILVIMIRNQNIPAGLFPKAFYFIHDSHKFMGFIIALSSFMWFKDLKIPQSKLINAIGGATFGVLLIHANSDTMRKWLWQDVVNVTGHFEYLTTFQMLIYATVTVIAIFSVCAAIDILRSKTLDKTLNHRVEQAVQNIITNIRSKRKSQDISTITDNPVIDNQVID